MTVCQMSVDKMTVDKMSHCQAKSDAKVQSIRDIEKY